MPSQERSSSSVRVFWPDRASLERALDGYVGLLAQRADVASVYLCGSWARGTYTAASDVDLAILIREDSPSARLSPRDRVPIYLPDSFPTGLDLFIYTKTEARVSSFVRSLLEDTKPVLPKPVSAG